jgi:plasmid stabilization system protein ParE
VNFRYLEAALLEVEEAAERYEQDRPGYGVVFKAEIDRSLALCLAHPASAPLSKGEPAKVGIRYRVLKRFPHTIIYAVWRGEILVIAVPHQRQQPGYWMDRVAPLAPAVDLEQPSKKRGPKAKPRPGRGR